VIVLVKNDLKWNHEMEKMIFESDEGAEADEVTRIEDTITFDPYMQPTYFFGSPDRPHSGLSGDIIFFKIGPWEHFLRNSYF
jgi:hypothetical protein